MKDLLLNRSKQSNGFHFTGNITVGSRTEDMTNGQYVYFYGFLRDYNTSTPGGSTWKPLANFGQLQGIEIINGLYSDKNNVNTTVETALTLMNNIDTTKYENKTFTITRLDTNLSYSFTYAYNELKETYTISSIANTFFDSSDVGKTITVQLVIA